MLSGLLAAAAALLTAACEQQQEGAVRATVIGERLRLADPASGSLETPEEVLLQNVAQGLVRFDAQGNIVAGLAERWNVSDDGLSYIFRLRTGEWPNGRKISAQDVARLLRRQTNAQSGNALKDSVGAISQIVAMTDRVIAIELSAPRPHLLQILAQPEFAIVRQQTGTGPFEMEEGEVEGGLLLTRPLPVPDGEEPQFERVELAAAEVAAAVRAFAEGSTDLVLGGRFADLPVALRSDRARGSVRFDPVAGLFGLMPARRTGIAADQELRGLLDRAIDREALVAALQVPDLEARATILQPGIDGGIVPSAPEWAAIPPAERREALLAEGRRLRLEEAQEDTAGPGNAEAEGEPRPIRIAVPEGPAAETLLHRLSVDWAPLGFSVERAEEGGPADFRLVDLVAPSASPAWFLRQFRCEVAPVCAEEADELLAAARTTTIPAQRVALFAEAERIMRERILFLPIAAPVRWSLVRGGLDGFAENRFARHTLVDLRGREGE